MKLKLIPNSHSKGPKPPQVSITMYGRLNFNQEAIKFLGLQEGQKIGVLNDEEKPDDFYVVIYDKDRDEELPKLMKPTKGNCLYVNYRSGAREIQERFKLKRIASVRIGGPVRWEGKSIHALITAPLKEKK